jgi:ABC-type transport system involved in cytochrome bd biosynthesis fused ATPase/permease subunit
MSDGSLVELQSSAPHVSDAVNLCVQDAVLFSGTVKENLFLGFNDLHGRRVSFSFTLWRGP